MQKEPIRSEVWFAWYPICTEDGCPVWLRKVKRVWDPKRFLRAIWMDDPGEYQGGWRYYTE